MSNVKSSTEQGIKVETLSPADLLDCGQATKVTKGVPYQVWWEPSPPPFDTAMN